MYRGLQKEQLRLYSDTWAVLVQLGEKYRQEAAGPALASSVSAH